MLRPHTRVRRRPVLAVLLFLFTASVGLGFWRDLGGGAASLYGYAVFAVLGTKLLLSLLPAKKWPEIDKTARSVGVVVTIYNEDPTYLRRCVDSLLRQTMLPSRIILVDDCSTDPAGFRLAKSYQNTYPDLIVATRHKWNVGKRHALVSGFRRLSGVVDVFLCVDSDTILEPTAIEEGMRPFADPTVMASTGVVLAANHESNVLTRLIDVRYVNAFLGERAAYSRIGNVLCVCGSLAFYRASAVMPNIRRFLDQKFLGKVATVGDDRHMTNLCLMQGKVVLVEGAICHTAVPERFGHYVRQQVRWGRSFFRESLWVLGHRRPTSAAWWLTLLELSQWFLFTTLLSYALLVHPFVTGHSIIGKYLLFVGVMALARSVRYFDIVRDRQKQRSRALSFLVSPLYGYMTLFVMIPLRLWSLLTLNNSVWGTRAKGAEVTMGAPRQQSASRPQWGDTPIPAHRLIEGSGQLDAAVVEPKAVIPEPRGARIRA